MCRMLMEDITLCKAKPYIRGINRLRCRENAHQFMGYAHLSVDHPTQRAQSHLPVADVTELPQEGVASPGTLSAAAG